MEQTTKNGGEPRKTEHRLSARVPHALKEDVEHLVARFGRLKFRTRKLGIEGVLCSAMLEFLDMEPARQAEILARNLPRVEAMFRDEGEGDAGPGVPYAIEPPEGHPSRRNRSR